jgi:hypothetical protein
MDRRRTEAVATGVPAIRARRRGGHLSSTTTSYQYRSRRLPARWRVHHQMVCRSGAIPETAGCARPRKILVLRSICSTCFRFDVAAEPWRPVDSALTSADSQPKSKCTQGCREILAREHVTQRCLPRSVGPNGRRHGSRLHGLTIEMAFLRVDSSRSPSAHEERSHGIRPTVRLAGPYFLLELGIF